MKKPSDRWPGGFSLKIDPELGGTDTGVGALEEQAHDKQNGHAASSVQQPDGKSAFGPAGAPGKG